MAQHFKNDSLRGRATSLSLCVWLALAACGEPVPARIEAPRDTITINTTLIEPVAAQVVDAQGRGVPRAVIGAVARPDSIVELYGRGGVQCRKNGVATLTLTSGALHATSTVRCHIADRIAMNEMESCLQVGDAPVPLSVQASDEEGRPMSQVRLSMRNSDTTILRLDEHGITALRPGLATIEASTGRREAVRFVAVVDSTLAVSRDSACALMRSSSYARPVDRGEAPRKTPGPPKPIR
jgi:hypothetical protein